MLLSYSSFDVTQASLSLSLPIDSLSRCDNTNAKVLRPGQAAVLWCMAGLWSKMYLGYLLLTVELEMLEPHGRQRRAPVGLHTTPFTNISTSSACIFL